MRSEHTLSAGGRRRRQRKSLRRTSATWIFLPAAFAGAFLLPAEAEGQRGRSQVEEGNRLYSEGRFGDAHQKYLEALLEDPESPLIRFNDGSALYQGEDFQRAMERFLEAAESGDPDLESAAWYNLGNALFRAQQLQESLEAFKQALRTDPSDQDAKHNLERVLEQLQQQEQQQQGEGENQEENQENQDQQGQQNPQQQEPEAQGEDPSQDQPDQEEQPQGEQPKPEEEGPQEQPRPQRGQMTPEEAERLLNAIREDPGDVNRKRVPTTGKKPRKEW
jgi:tetratricopeptide (TPR) repeat protein